MDAVVHVLTSLCPAANRIKEHLNLTEQTVANDLWSHPGIGEGISSMILNYVTECKPAVPALTGSAARTCR